MSQGNAQVAQDKPAGGTLPSQAPGPGSEKGMSQRTGLQKPGQEGGELVTSKGRTKIADGVVAKIAGMAAREIGGVHNMGAGMARTLGTVRERLPGGMGRQSATQGVSVQVGERQAAVDLDLVVEYGVSIPDLASAVRENVINEIEHMCGLDVVEVNISVADIFMAGEDEGESDESDEQPRVQ